MTEKKDPTFSLPPRSTDGDHFAQTRPEGLDRGPRARHYALVHDAPRSGLSQRPSSPFPTPGADRPLPDWSNPSVARSHSAPPMFW